MCGVDAWWAWALLVTSYFERAAGQPAYVSGCPCPCISLLNLHLTAPSLPPSWCSRLPFCNLQFGTAGCTLQLWTVAACVYFGDAVVSTDTPRNLRGDAAAASIPAPEPLSWPARPPTPKTLGGTAACDAATGLPLGVSLRDAEARGLAAQYSTCCSGSGPVFVCDGGATQLPCTRVGDDYCDCQDGSDEPRNAACSSGRFYCNQGVAEFPKDYASRTPRRCACT